MTSPSPPRGAPKGCCPICRPRHRTGCSTTSPHSVAPGSRLATEHVPDPNAFTDERLQHISERWRSFGFGLNAGDLFYQGQRNVVVDYLSNHGWEVTAHPAKELYARNGFEFPENELTAVFGDFSYVAATLK